MSPVEPEGRANVLQTLGLSVTDLFQNEAIVFVEGKTDVAILSGLFPIEASRVSIRDSNGAAEVEAHARTLQTLEDFPLKWLGVRDRDLLPESALDHLPSQIHVWRGRSIENNFVDQRLIERTLMRLGADGFVPLSMQTLRELADAQQASVVAAALRIALDQTHRVVPVAGSEESVERLVQRYEHIAATTQTKLAALDRTRAEVEQRIAAQWDDNWAQLVDAKRLLREYASRVRFGADQFMRALIRTCAEEPEFLPPDLAAFGEKLSALVTRGPTAAG